MAQQYSVFATSIGRKLVMALSGLFMIVFLVVHIAGNFALFRSDYGKFFNQYSEFMSHNALIQIVQWTLFASILVHMYMAARLTQKNAAARPVGYTTNHREANSTWVSRNMGITGTVIGLFLAVHLYAFFFRYHYGDPRWISYDGGNTYYKDMYNMVEAAFSNSATASIACAIFYLVALVFLFGHLIHGIQSSMRTTGINHKKYQKIIMQATLGLTVFFAVGFASMPFAFMTGMKKQFEANSGITLDNTKRQEPIPGSLKTEESGDSPTKIIITPSRPDGQPDLGKLPGPRDLSKN